MRGWLPIRDPQVLAWLALEAWLAEVMDRAAARGPLPFTPERFAHALGYPWERPPGSFLLRDGRVELLVDHAPADRRALVAELARGRHPLVAFGVNGAPDACGRASAAPRSRTSSS